MKNSERLLKWIESEASVTTSTEPITFFTSTRRRRERKEPDRESLSAARESIGATMRRIWRGANIREHGHGG